MNFQGRNNENIRNYRRSSPAEFSPNPNKEINKTVIRGRRINIFEKSDDSCKNTACDSSGNIFLLFINQKE